MTVEIRDQNINMKEYIAWLELLYIIQCYRANVQFSNQDAEPAHLKTFLPEAIEELAAQLQNWHRKNPYAAQEASSAECTIDAPISQFFCKYSTDGMGEREHFIALCDLTRLLETIAAPLTRNEPFSHDLNGEYFQFLMEDMQQTPETFLPTSRSESTLLVEIFLAYNELKEFLEEDLEEEGKAIECPTLDDYIIQLSRQAERLMQECALTPPVTDVSYYTAAAIGFWDAIHSVCFIIITSHVEDAKKSKEYCQLLDSESAICMTSLPESIRLARQILSQDPQGAIFCIKPETWDVLNETIYRLSQHSCYADYFANVCNYDNPSIGGLSEAPIDLITTDPDAKGTPKEGTTWIDLLYREMAATNAAKILSALDEAKRQIGNTIIAAKTGKEKDTK